MKKRKKNQESIQNKIKNKIALKSKKKKKDHLYKGPEKFIGRYLAAQKSYSYLKKRVIIFLCRIKKYQIKELQKDQMGLETFYLLSEFEEFMTYQKIKNLF